MESIRYVGTSPEPPCSPAEGAADKRDVGAMNGAGLASQIAGRDATRPEMAAGPVPRSTSPRGPIPVRTGGRPAPEGGAGRLSIMHVVAPEPVGGVQTVVHALATGHVRRGHTVRVVAVLARGEEHHPLLRRLVGTGVEVHPVFLEGRSYLQERRIIRDLCGRYRPDVVHTHGYRTDVLSSGVARRLRIPTVTTVHGFTGGDLKNRAYEWLQCRAFRGIDAVVAVSRPMVPRLRRAGIRPDLIHVVPNAYSRVPSLGRAEARRRLGIRGGEFHVGWVGRLSREKGPDLLVEALALLPDTCVRASFLGDGGEKGRLAARARELGVDGSIHWRGVVEDAGSILSAFDVLVLSSRTEGTPMVLLEAMGAGVPTIVTRVGGVPDVVTGAESVLVPPESPAALARAIEAVRADPVASAERVRSARARLLSRFDSETWLARYEAVYHQVQSRSPAYR